MCAVNSTVLQGQMSAAGRRFAIVAARFNDFFSSRLIEGAQDAIVRHGGSLEEVTIVRVPGSFEIPLAAKELAVSRKVDAVIAIGCLLKGETDHYDLIAGNLASGLSRVMTETGVPVTLGVICADSMEQAMARSGSKVGNYGAEAALAAIEMVSVLQQLRE